VTDDLFDLAASLGDVASVYSGRDSGSAGERLSRPVQGAGRGGKGAVERAPRLVELLSGGGRAGGSSPAPGAVSGFALPVPLGAPRFDGDGPVRPGHPGPPPPPPPTPYPPPRIGGPLSEVMACCWCVPGCPIDCCS